MDFSEDLLNNPIWNALTGAQASFALGGAGARRYQPNIVPFAGFADLASPDWAELRSISTIGEQLLIPPVPIPDDAGFQLLMSGMIRQYIFRAKSAPQFSSNWKADRLSEADIPAMLKLAEEADLGGMAPRALEIGDFIGVRINGQLVAMAGQRLQIGPFREVSEVCTTPAYAGKGMATALVCQLIDEILARNEIPILHVDVNNARAISIYERLGFVQRGPAQTGIHIVQYIGVR